MEVLDSMKRAKILSKIFCGVIAASIAGTAMASAATGDVAATFDRAAITVAQGVTNIEDGYRMLIPSASNTSSHTIYGLEAGGLDGTKAYTIAVKVRLNGYENDDAGEEGTEKKAKVFGIDPKFNDEEGVTSPEQDPVDCWFTAQDIWNAIAKYGDGEFITYYVVVKPDTNYYKGINKLRIENRIAYMGASGEQYMKLAVDSLTIYEGEYNVPNGVKGTNLAAATSSADEDTSSKAGGSIYNQYASYKGSNKDYVDYNYSNASYNEVVSSSSSNGGGSDASGSSIVSDSGIPQSGSKGIAMAVLAMGGAAVLGGAAVVAGKRRKSNKK